MTTTNLKITEPGMYADISDKDYHEGDLIEGGAVSSTTLRNILAQTPAAVQWEREHPKPYNPNFEVGRAAHTLATGQGQEFAVIDANDWRTKAAKEERDKALAQEKTPLLAKQFAQVQAMADALLAHPTVGPLLTDPGVLAEQSIFWIDPDYGQWCKARPDILVIGPERVTAIDYKSAADASRDGFSRAIGDFGYHQQQCHYETGIKEIGLAQDKEVDFLFIVQEKEPPHLVHVMRLYPADVELGYAMNAAAMDLYTQCESTGEWPGYPETVTGMGMRKWAFEDKRRYLEDWG